MKKTTTRETFVGCSRCGGVGVIQRRWSEGSRDSSSYEYSGTMEVTCPACKGTGRVFSFQEVTTEEELKED